jgi:hypothetical protein
LEFGTKGERERERKFNVTPGQRRVPPSSVTINAGFKVMARVRDVTQLSSTRVIFCSIHVIVGQL